MCSKMLFFYLKKQCKVDFYSHQTILRISVIVSGQMHMILGCSIVSCSTPCGLAHELEDDCVLTHVLLC